MAKICTTCGLKYKDSATKCVNCKSELEIIETPQKKKKAIIAICLAAFCLVLALLLTLALIIFTGPRGRVRYIMNNLRDNDVEAVLDTLPDFLIDENSPYGHEVKLALSRYTSQLSNYVYSFNTNKTADPSSAQMTELMNSIKKFAGDDFDETLIEDVKIVWVDFRGGIHGFWNSIDSRFIMIKYKGEWCWWPYY